MIYLILHIQRASVWGTNVGRLIDAQNHEETCIFDLVPN